MNIPVTKWGGLASFLLAISFVIAPAIYLAGNLRDALGILAYNLADFLYGPVLSISLIVVTYVLREQIRNSAPHRMNLALLSALLAAAGMAAVAFIRASNRQHHLTHPELNLENSVIVLTVWKTLIGGVSALGFHFLGWTFLLIGSASWKSQLFPQVLSALYILTGISSLFAYLFPDIEGGILLLGVIISVWQGVLLWKVETKEKQD